MTDTDLLQCRRLLRGGSRSFHVASLLLPPSLRDPASALYAFCRLADDAIDCGEDAESELRLLRGRLSRIYQRQPDDIAADRTFASTIQRFEIPQALPQLLLEGFEWDAESRRYETLEDLCSYAVRVAGTVGVMMTLLMRQRDPLVLARAVELGIAMQLTNIARDVGEDARAGRLYLPLRWLREAGIDPEAFLAKPEFTPQLASVVERLLSAARGFYDRSITGIAHLPPSCRPGIHAARLIYSAIGDEVTRRNLDSVSSRAVVPAARKLHALVRAVGASFAVARPFTLPVLPEAAMLLDGITAQPVRYVTRDAELPPSWWRVGSRAVRLIELLERIERRQMFKRVSF